MLSIPEERTHAIFNSAPRQHRKRRPSRQKTHRYKEANSALHRNRADRLNHRTHLVAILQHRVRAAEPCKHARAQPSVHGIIINKQNVHAELFDLLVGACGSGGGG